MSEQTAFPGGIGDQDRRPSTGMSDVARRSPIHGAVLLLALLTCLVIVALPLLGSLALAGAVLGLFTGGGLATLYVLARD